MCFAQGCIVEETEFKQIYLTLILGFEQLLEKSIEEVATHSNIEP